MCLGYGFLHSLLVIQLTLVALSVVVEQTAASSSDNGRSAVDRPPNIVLVLTDDQDVVLGGADDPPMHRTHQLFRQGALFSNAFTTTPICCPSRSSILTGKYAHNVQVHNNTISGGCSSPQWQREHETSTFATHLQQLGYVTFYAGKYLNEYGHAQAGGCSHVPPGWDWWLGLVGNSRYYNYTLCAGDGTTVRHGDDYRSDYLTDVIKRHALRFLANVTTTDDDSQPQKPFLLVLSTPAPHTPFTPAPQYEKDFQEHSAPRMRNFNVRVDESKHWLLRLPPSPLPREEVDIVDEAFRNRWRSLRSVDDLVDEVHNAIDFVPGLMENTYSIYTSDNGYHLGQFSLPMDKRQPYEFDIRIPMLVRGPGIDRKTVSNIVLNIDLMPTIMEMAGSSSPPRGLDGRSFLSLAKMPSAEDPRETEDSMKNELTNSIFEPVEKYKRVQSTTSSHLFLDFFDWFNTLRLFGSFLSWLDIYPYQTASPEPHRTCAYDQFSAEMAVPEEELINEKLVVLEEINEGSSKPLISEWRTGFLVEYWGQALPHSSDPSCPWSYDPAVETCRLNEACKCEDSLNNTYTCLRQIVSSSDRYSSNDKVNMIYCEFVDSEHFKEAYDLLQDPDQLVNIAEHLSPRQLKAKADTLERLRSCSAHDCWI